MEGSVCFSALSRQSLGKTEEKDKKIVFRIIGFPFEV
jgi:hypothetical protein